MGDPVDDLPAISDLERRAHRRLPHFAWEYLASGTGADQTVQRNLDALAEVCFVPQLLKGPLDPTLTTELFGVSYAAPIGIAPVGLTGLIWPGADEALALTAAERRIPYVLSTVATERPEVAGPNAGGMGWFQLYPPRDEGIRSSMLERAAASGFTTLVVTADVPAPSQRERQRKARIRVPPKIGPSLIAQAALRPAWTWALMRNGMPRFRGLEAYLDRATMQQSAGFVGANLGGTLSYAYLEEVRGLWDGPIVVKGILDPDDARRCVESGADAIAVSNHGGRQLDAAPAAIDALPAVADRVGSSVPVLFDSGVRSGLDIARALALGASFVFCGRAFMFGLGALGREGVGHTLDILTDGLRNVMIQTGCDRIEQLSERLQA
jgi:L-lactate dehydrogenase (cytochrome)